MKVIIDNIKYDIKKITNVDYILNTPESFSMKFMCDHWYDLEREREIREKQELRINKLNKLNNL